MSTPDDPSDETIYAEAAQLIPVEWSQHPVWVEGYQIGDANGEPRAYRATGNDRVRAVILHGKMAYIDQRVISVHATTPRQPVPEVEWEAGVRETAHGWYLILCRPTPDGNEDVARADTAAYRGLAMASFGRNMALNRLFAYMHNPDGTQSFATVGKPNPYTLPPVTVVDESPRDLCDLIVRVESHDEAERIKLALSWYESASADSGSNGYLKLWIAVEALIGIPKGGDLTRLRETLAQGYGITAHAASSKFLVKRLWSIRNRIVHDGYMPRFHYALFDYLGAIFQDVLHVVLGIPCPRFAGRLENPGLMREYVLALSRGQSTESIHPRLVSHPVGRYLRVSMTPDKK